MKIYTFLSFGIVALIFSSSALIAQIPATTGLPIKWTYLFSDPTTTPPNTSVYAEDHLVDPTNGQIHFLHNTGLLEGSLISTLDNNGNVVNITANRIDNTGYRLVGTSLEKIGQQGHIRMLGQAIYSSNVIAIPPAGRFAFSDISNGNSQFTVPDAQQTNALRSFNDRGLPCVAQSNTGDYFEVQPRMTQDNQYVAWIRKASGTDARGLDTLGSLPRFIRNGQQVGNTSDDGRVRGLLKLPNAQYTFLYSQPGNYLDTTDVVVQLAFFDEVGNIFNTVDLSSASGYSFFPEIIYRNGKIYVYGTVANVLFPSIDKPYAHLAILDGDGNLEWSGKISDSFGENIPFQQFEVLPNGNLLFIAPFINNEGNSGFKFYQWELGNSSAILLKEIVFNDPKSRVACTSLFLDAGNDPIVMFQLDKFNNIPTPGQIPDNNVYHAALSLTTQNLGIVSTQEYIDKFTDAALFPNPSDGLLYISGLPESEPFRYDVCNILGNSLLVINAESAKEPLQISHLPSGIYLLNISDRVGNYRTFKFIRQ
jgi:hypothetical protein